MKGLIFAIALLSVLPSLLRANPLSEETEGVSIRETLTTFLRVRRQSPPSTCTSNADCLADPNQAQPRAEIVQCFNSACECNDCFMMDSQGLCNSTLCPDYLYNNASAVCARDNRPTQLTAFLLTLFVSSTGAANFYIGQSGLGGGQIALLLIIFAVSYSMCCFPCCLACCMDDVKGSIIFIILMLLFSIVVIVASLAISAWYIADVIVFATNQRLAGNGCMLTPWS